MSYISEPSTVAPLPNCNFVIWTSPSADAGGSKPTLTKLYEQDQPRGKILIL